MKANLKINTETNAQKIESWPARRKIAGLSLDNMAELTGISKSQLSLYENKHTKPNYTAIDKVEAVLKKYGA